MEAQREDNLHSLLDEMHRWRDIIGVDYLNYKAPHNQGGMWGL